MPRVYPVRKILVASVGAAAMTYGACGSHDGIVGNLMAVPEVPCATNADCADAGIYRYCVALVCGVPLCADFADGSCALQAPVLDGASSEDAASDDGATDGSDAETTDAAKDGGRADADGAPVTADGASDQ